MRGRDPREGEIAMKETDEMKKREEQPTELQSTTKSQPMTATSPFGLIRRFAEDMEKMFEDFGDFRFPRLFVKEFFPFRTEMNDVAWIPEIEVTQNKEQLTVRCDLPGMKKDDIKIELRDEVLMIAGERNEEKKEEREGYYRSERSYGTFYRQVPLPAGVKTDTAEATFRDGVLEVKMLATAKELPSRKLEIKEPTTDKPLAKAAA
jgi:HSP20 family protein